MTASPALPFVSVDEYLSSAYEHDVEFVDGLLVERGMPTPPHSTLQLIVGGHLRTFRKQFHYGVMSECRVELVKRSRYRIPDVLICSLPIPKGNVVDTVPLAVVEIWSPDDRIGQQMARFSDYWALGIRQIIVLDPETLTTFRYEDGSLIEGLVHELHLPDGREVPFPSSALLEELRQELERS